MSTENEYIKVKEGLTYRDIALTLLDVLEKHGNMSEFLKQGLAFDIMSRLMKGDDRVKNTREKMLEGRDQNYKTVQELGVYTRRDVEEIMNETESDCEDPNQ